MTEQKALMGEMRTAEGAHRKALCERVERLDEDLRAVLAELREESKNAGR